MADFTYLGKCRPLDGSIVRKFPVGAAIGVNDAFLIQTDGTIIKSVNASSIGAGVVVAFDNKTASGAAGDVASCVMIGPISGFSGLTPGQLGYLSATTGKLATTGSKAMGYAESDQVFFVMPGVSVAAS